MLTLAGDRSLGNSRLEFVAWVFSLDNFHLGFSTCVLMGATVMGGAPRPVGLRPSSRPPSVSATVASGATSLGSEGLEPLLED